MENSSIDSEMIESLNILRPPVKRVRTTDDELRYFNSQPNNVLFVSDYRKKQRKRSKFNRNRRLVESSTSLILQKTSDAEQIYEKLSIVSNTEIFRNEIATKDKQKNRFSKKPVIQVIVIPKRSRIPRGAAHKERKLVTKIINNSQTDIEEDSIQTKKIYIVVSGKKKEKIYEIKTAESAKEFDIDDISNEVLNDIDFDSPEKELNIFDESIMASVNYGTNYDRSMKSEDDKENEQHVLYSHDCQCCGCTTTTKKPGDKNKIKIFGQLGLTEDDRYVLKCGATLNNQPIITDFQRVGEKVSSRDYVKLNSMNYQTTKPLIAKLTSLGNSSRDFEPPSLSLSLARPKKKEMVPNTSTHRRSDRSRSPNTGKYERDKVSGHNHYTFYQSNEFEKGKRNSTSNEEVVDGNQGNSSNKQTKHYGHANKRISRDNSPGTHPSDFENVIIKDEQKIVQQYSSTHRNGGSKKHNKAIEIKESDRKPTVKPSKSNKEHLQQGSIRRKEISENVIHTKQVDSTTQDNVTKDESNKLQVPFSDNYSKLATRSPRTSADLQKGKLDVKIPYQESKSKSSVKDANQINVSSVQRQQYNKTSPRQSPKQNINEKIRQDSKHRTKEDIIQISNTESNKSDQAIHMDIPMNSRKPPQKPDLRGHNNTTDQQEYHETFHQRGYQETNEKTYNETLDQKGYYDGKYQREHHEMDHRKFLEIPEEKEYHEIKEQIRAHYTPDQKMQHETSDQKTQREIAEIKAQYETPGQRTYQEHIPYPDNFANYRQPHAPTLQPYPNNYMNHRPQVPGAQDPRGYQDYQGPYPNYYYNTRPPPPMIPDQRRYLDMQQPYPRVYQEFHGYYPDNPTNSRPPPPVPQPLRYPEYQVPYQSYPPNFRQPQIMSDQRGYQESVTLPESKLNSNKEEQPSQDMKERENKNNIRDTEKYRSGRDNIHMTKVLKKTGQVNTKKKITKTKETQKTTPGNLSRYIDSFRSPLQGSKGAEELYEQVFGINNFHKSEAIQVKLATTQFHKISSLDNIFVCDCKESRQKLISDENLNLEKDELNVRPSPMVVISVYPKEENTNETCNPKCCNQNAYPLIQSLVSKTGVVNFDDNVEVKSDDRTKSPAKSLTPRSRSSSPSSKRTHDSAKVVETRMLRTETRTKSPTQSRIFNKGKKVDDLNKRPSPKSFGETKFKSKEHLRKKPKSRSHDKGVNTELIRNANDSDNDKVDSDLLKIKINRSLKANVSAISVNIDSENEFYDVSFQQGKFVTDLSVCKTSKESAAQYSVKRKSDSLENFLPVMQDNQETAIEKYENLECLPTEDTNSLIRNVTGLKPRDSLEIKHRTEDKNNETPTQTENLIRNSVSRDELEFFAPIKHFAGDDCQIIDPVERDKEIRKLLGVDRRIRISSSNEEKIIFEEDGMQHYYKSQRCKNTIVAFGSCCSQSQDTCSSKTRNKKQKNKSKCVIVESISSCGCEPALKTKKPKKKQSFEVKHYLLEPPKPKPRCVFIPKYCPEPKPREQKTFCGPCCEGHLVKSQCESLTCQPPPYAEPESNCKPTITVTTCCSRSEPTVERTSLYQQLILNRNIQVFLQVEQFCKQKPICLSRKQYDKVKKTIQKTLSNKSKKSKQDKNCSNNEYDVQGCCSRGQVRPTQTSKSLNSSCSKIANCVRKSLMKIANRFCDDPTCNTVLIYRQDVGNDPKENFKCLDVKSPLSIIPNDANMNEVPSSVSAIGSSAASSLNIRRRDSIETLFREHKRTHTPNLGTSDITDATAGRNSASAKITQSKDKPKRPFFKRLMSCLVMRSEKTPVVPFMPVQKEHVASINSSVDSYHLSTSLGPIEMSSSLYDTSVSFYTNHSIRPEIYKIRRGLLSSVRGFLSSRRN